MLFRKKKEQTELVSLDDKIDEFIDSYQKVIANETLPLLSAREVRNLIEKVATWYELRYPDYEVNKVLPFHLFDNTNIDEVTFKDNPNYNGPMNSWKDFYNFDTFTEQQPLIERLYLSEIPYPSIVYLDTEKTYLNPETGKQIKKTPCAHLHLTKDGVVEDAEFLYTLTPRTKVLPQELCGKKLEDAVSYLEQKGIEMSPYSEANRAIKQREILDMARDGILDCAMYEIIERGGSKVGPRRGLMFATEFGRNIDIPMQYGIDYQDITALDNLITSYLSLGGHEDLMCYEGYFYQPKGSELNKTSLSSTIKLLSPTIPNPEKKL